MAEDNEVFKRGCEVVVYVGKGKAGLEAVKFWLVIILPATTLDLYIHCLGRRTTLPRTGPPLYLAIKSKEMTVVHEP